ncbi:MAG: branched-chain amino acid ABC transporter permease, partial [Bacteroidota bacterium]
MKIARPYLMLLIGIAVVFLLLILFYDQLGSYDQRIVINIGIAMILAASLNLINGFTGQFSLGHAGFMSVGAYTSAALTTMILPKLIGAPAAGGIGEDFYLLISLILGGTVAAVAGLLVGVPSLRLKGDYLAIVTLGFGEIIRVVLQNIESLGG